LGRFVSWSFHRFGVEWLPDFGQVEMYFEGCFVLVSASAGVSLAKELVFDVWVPSGVLGLTSIRMFGGMLRMRWVSACVA
jgi:hypothetical protein